MKLKIELDKICFHFDDKLGVGYNIFKKTWWGWERLNKHPLKFQVAQRILKEMVGFHFWSIKFQKQNESIIKELFSK
jgi:hypothetical protein